MEGLILYDEIEPKEELTEQSNKNKSFITFAKFNKSFLILLFLLIFNLLSYIFGGFFYNYQIFKQPEFIISIFYDSHNVFAGLFYFIPCFQINVNIQKKFDNKKKIKEDRNYILKKSSLNIISAHKNIMFFLLLGLMYAIDDLLFSFIFDKIVFDEGLYYLFFIPLFSKIILKENIYKHQYFSLLIAIIGIIFIIIPICFKLSVNDIAPNFLNFIKSTNYPLILVIIKYMIEKYYLPPLKICLIIGIVTVIINVIGYTIYSLIIDDFSYFSDCLDFSHVDNKLVTSIYFIFYFLFATASKVSLFVSTFYFSPTLIMVTDTISLLLSWIVSLFFQEKLPDDITFKAIGYLIALFSTLIYNEIIIFNCCGLNKNTKKFVNNRINKELEEIHKSEEFFLSDNDEDSLIFNDNKD